MEQSPAGWSGELAKAIGRRVAYFRNRLPTKMTAQGLADRCAELGHPLDRSVIAKLEKGHRHTMTVADVLVLARALNVSVVELVFPLGAEPAVDVLPGEPRPTWDAAKWFTGEAKWAPRVPGEPGPEPIRLWREHDAAVNEWLRVRPLALHSEEERDRKAMLAVLSQAEARLHRIRAEMRRTGLAVLPDLPGDLAYVDQTCSDDGDGANLSSTT